jgi:molecular chaperone HtpG
LSHAQQGRNLSIACRLFFNDELKSIYYAGSKVNSAFDKIEKAKLFKDEFASQIIVSKEQQEKLKKAEIEAKKAELELVKLQEKTKAKLSSGNIGTAEVVVREIIKQNKKKRDISPEQKPSPESTPIKGEMRDEVSVTPVVVTVVGTRSENKLVPLDKVFSIIRSLVDSSMADTIVAKLEEELN